MYVPSSFRMDDPAELHEFMRLHGFAALVTWGDGGATASHVPLLFDADGGPRGRLVGHLARANPQWRAAPAECLAIFAGPHAYVSPTWYDEPGTVPTWNYVVVHAHGTLRLVENRDGLRAILRRLTAAYEAPMPTPWVYDETDPEIEKMLDAVVGFEIEIARLEGKAKLNQNHPAGRRRNVIRALEAGPDDDSRAIARLMTGTMKDDRGDESS